MAGAIGLLVVLAAAAALLVGATVLLLAQMLLRPPRMTDGKAVWVLKRLSPGDLGLDYQDEPFTVRDEATGRTLQLAGWWIPHPEARGRCLLMIHGYADAKVGVIAWAPLLHELGWNILAIDLRAHGQSEGKYMTAGYLERHDIAQVIDQIRARRPQQTRQLALFGVSMGAAVAAAAAALREDIAAVILDSPFADLREAAKMRGPALGMPGGFVQQWALRLAGQIARADFASVRPVATIRQCRAPILLIHSGQDVFLTPADAEALEAAVRDRPSDAGPGVFWHVEGVGHLMAVVADPAEYQRRVGEFLEKATQGAVGVRQVPCPE